MLIRREEPADADRVREIHLAAFPGPAESKLAADLRTGGFAIPELSLVAVIDGDVVAHVVCSRGSIDGRPSVGLGPIGVMPDLQGKAIGSALMHAVLAAADALGEPVVALLGNPDYYGRFGFVASTDAGILPPDPEWGVFFQARILTAFTAADTGTFQYAAPFDDL